MVDFRGQGWKILLVDDVEANRRVVELFLKNTNVTLVHAENGKIAVEKFVEEPYDLVLMDMEMPVMDGLDATRRIRMWEQEKREYRTPIVALTAHAFQEHRQKTMDAGCTEFLAKPIKKQSLLGVIDMFAGKREPIIGKALPESVPSFTVPESRPEDISPVQIDPELEDLRPLFLRTVRDFQSQIADAIDTEDYPALQRCGHSLKGLGSTYAVDEISQAGRIIETAAKSRQQTVIREAARHLGIFMNTGSAPKIQAAEVLGNASLGDFKPSANGRYAVHVAPEMSELIPFLMDAMQKDLELMNKALGQKDFATIRRFGHSHKGFGTTYGFDFISAVGLKIQTAAEARDDGQIAELLVTLSNYLERVDIIYDSKPDDLLDASIEEPIPGDATADVTQVVRQDLLVEVDAELFELVPLFMETMTANIDEMQEALLTKDYDVICRHGHSQKGLGSTYGFDYLGHLGYKIETAGMQKDDDEVRKLLDEMSVYLKNVQIVEREG